MKMNLNKTCVFIAALATASVLSAKPIPGPRGGKIVTTEAPYVEFYVAPDRTVVVAFYDEDLKPTTPVGKRLFTLAEAEGGKTMLGFRQKDGAWLSSSPLPAGHGYTIVLQIRDAATSKPSNYRIELHDEVCGECKRAEYACICETPAAPSSSTKAS